jgi:hypothetical protein
MAVRLQISQSMTIGKIDLRQVLEAGRSAGVLSAPAGDAREWYKETMMCNHFQ